MCNTQPLLPGFYQTTVVRVLNWPDSPTLGQVNELRYDS